jgi:hypothetical protein
MNQIDQYNRRVQLESQIEELEAQIKNLTREARKLPICPCCPNSKEFCLVDGLRGNSREFNIKAAEKLGIAPENLLAAVDFKYTLTEEEVGHIINAINNPYDFATKQQI